MKSKIGIVNMKRTLGLLLTAACFAGGFGKTTAQEITEPEMLEVRYTKGANSYTNQVAKDVEELFFDHYIDELILPEGLTKLHTLGIHQGARVGTTLDLRTLTLPKDIGKDADWPFRLMIAHPNSINGLALQVHKDMGQFSLSVIRDRFLQL